LMDCSFVASINRTPITTSSSSFSSSSPNANGRPQKFCTLRSSFNLRSMDSSFWNGGGVYNSCFFVTLISLLQFLTLPLPHHFFQYLNWHLCGSKPGTMFSIAHKPGISP
jgi:hypothetical protein